MLSQVLGHPLPAGDAEAMATALVALLGDSALQIRLSAAALAMPERDFHPNVVAGQTVAFVKEVLARPTHI